MATLQSFPAKWKAARKACLFTFTNELPNLLPFRIFAGLPEDHANASDKPFVEIGQVDGNMGLDGVIRVNVSEYIQSYNQVPLSGFRPIQPPEAGIDIHLFTAYYVKYGNAYIPDLLSYTSQIRSPFGTTILVGTGGSQLIDDYTLGQQVYLLNHNAPAEEAKGPFVVQGFLSSNNDLIINQQFGVNGFQGGSIYSEEQIEELLETQYQDTPVRWALHSSIDPDYIDRSPSWQVVEESIRCVQEEPRTSADREAQFIDDNPCSTTYGELRGAGAYFFYDNNEEACELSTIPNPQFAGTIVCVPDRPPFSSATQQRKRDINIHSETYNQWLKADDSYVVLEADGDYFLTGDNDEALCPLRVSLSVVIPSGDVTASINGR